MSMSSSCSGRSTPGCRASSAGCRCAPHTSRGGKAAHESSRRHAVTRPRVPMPGRSLLGSGCSAAELGAAQVRPGSYMSRLDWGADMALGPAGPCRRYRRLFARLRVRVRSRFSRAPPGLPRAVANAALALVGRVAAGRHVVVFSAGTRI